ncbi:MAG: hypothetical protein COX77_03940 [Candidatus Komeilibacteria bacterium CG_4_10_14_0_2_um_filter_37_10]|uniref:Cell division protein FtsQ/DivIB C-terminal domain-containing protein n=1 Tax=Candidatus Komeilibacteria bacterium CG_4_10_14_0_2_um_filter_37_10 TaxID=1974470 RepID=A0A2M7VDW1_9BACT|nr:MAG: hypothetical protein COX77_03940 [Candidatus Komeilibacteria bacterium CG_4_10_14_0_2_um_filter_37_10]
MILIYFVFYSNLWNIRYLKITDSSITDTIPIENTIWYKLQGHYYLLVSKSNYWFIQTSLLNQQLLEQYPYLNIVIEKKFPRTMIVNISPKNSKIIWQKGDIYYLVDNEGQLIHELRTNTIKRDNFVIIEDRINNSVQLGARLLKIEDLNGIMSVVAEFKEMNFTNLQFNRVIYDDISLSTIKILTNNNIEIHLSYRKNITDQLNKLKLAIAQNKLDFTTIHYINLKIDQQVIYQ